MDISLGDRSLLLIGEPYMTEFAIVWYINLYMKFKDAFLYFLNDCDVTTTHIWEENKNKMKTPWMLQYGWLVLQTWINDGTIYALFAQHAIPNYDVINMVIQTI